ncbi:MAG TPA: PKD domain-containing protein [Chitinophagaceae bacterium]|nr:PKD domain-containing protein [Chitinophagaceae bacterium]
MKNIFFTILLFSSFFLQKNGFSQPPPPNCPPAYSAGFNIVGDSISYCNDGVNLTIQPFSDLFGTDSYSVTQIPYNPYPWVGANQILVGVDDIFSGVVQLPFPFCFFGQKYNSIVVGANGQISFDITQANQYNPWATQGWVAPYNSPGMNNTIMAPYHDVNPAVYYQGSNITWGIYGTAPCRYCVISWDSIPMFSCTQMLASQQIVLFESTYLIDINIKGKPVCAGWNGGVAHEGIQNATATKAFMVPGRNGTVFSLTNDSYRFTPKGTQTLNYDVTWRNAITGDVLGVGNTLNNYFPPADTKVTASMTVYTDCDTLNAAVVDTIDVIVTGSATANFDYDIHLGCKNDTIFFTNTSVHDSLGTPNYLWWFGDGAYSTLLSPNHIYQTQNIYNVTLIATLNGCSDTIVKQIDIRHPLQAVFGSLDSICITTPLMLSSTSTPAGFIQHYWNFGDGHDTTSGTGALMSHYYNQGGSFDVKMIITDTLGCRDSMSKTIFVDLPTFVDFVMSDSMVCAGDPVFLIDSIAPSFVDFYWDFGDGQTHKNNHNPIHVWDTPGSYTVSLSTERIVCPEGTKQKNITVNAYPNVSLGPDTSICPGLTNPILLSDVNNPFALHLWSTGETGSSISVTEPGRYWVKASNGNCATSDSIWVKRDCYLNIPNSFSPNGDGLNDYFLPRELLSSGLTSFKMDIYNRWGENIFTTNSIDGRGWDGKYNGVLQPIGVYVYLIEGEFINGVKKTYQGNVTLIR